MYYNNEKSICENIKKLLESEYKNIKVKIIYDDEHLIATFIIKMAFKTNKVKFKHKQSVTFNYDELESLEYYNLCKLILYNVKEDIWSFYIDYFLNKMPRVIKISNKEKEVLK